MNFNQPLTQINPFIIQGNLSFWANKLLAWLIIIAVILALGYIIYAGLLFITSGGKQEKYEQALKTIGYTILGLLIVFSSVAIISFISNLFGFNFLNGLLNFQVVFSDIHQIAGNLSHIYSGSNNLNL